ncbi:MAG: hypothetical protein L0H79_19520 [Intrasporangium sp.]|nr:hypothetical protein [Intrasporangium sp.]MDN5797915.1 hypothetical protein [Intrasporangium sp.]
MAADCGPATDTAMAQRYAPVIDPIRRDIADRVGGLLWDRPEPPPEAK